MPEYDCIIPWSGGVESTAVVNWAVNNNKTPLCIHVRMNPAEWSSVQKMSSLFNVNVFKIEQDISQLPVDPNNRDFYSKKLGYHKKWSPVIHNWVYWASFANITNPTIKNIFYGHCGAGLVEQGDGLGDQMHDGAVAIFNSFENYFNAYFVDSKFIAPLDHLTKREQWLTLPNEIKKEIFTCNVYESIINETNCRKCPKCTSLTRAVPENEWHFIK